MQFREKYLRLPRADVYVIQECENPETSADKYYREFAANSLWQGDKNNKGLGVFAKSEIKLEKLNWQSGCLKYFLPVRIDEKINLLAVWTPTPYVEDYNIYQSFNISKYNKKTIILGDFGTNVRCDKRHKDRTHMSVINDLKKLGLESIYHNKYAEDHGEETKPTTYLRKNREVPCHFSYCFADPDMVCGFEIQEDETRLKYSAHMPLVLEINTENISNGE